MADADLLPPPSAERGVKNYKAFYYLQISSFCCALLLTFYLLLPGNYKVKCRSSIATSVTTICYCICLFLYRSSKCNYCLIDLTPRF